MTVVIDVGIINSTISGDYPSKELDKELSFYPDDYMYRPGNKKWDGKIHMITPAGKFPTGLLNKVCELLDELGTQYGVNKETRKIIEFNDITLPDITLRPYQQKAVLKMLQKKRGVIKIPTAGGKTNIAAAAIKAFNLPCIYIVHTTTLLEQTLNVFEKIFPGRVGVVGSGKYNWNIITIGMVKTLKNLIDEKQITMFKYYEMIITDECHHLASSKTVSWYVVAQHFKNAWVRFGMSATPVLRKKGMLLTGATGPVIVDVPITELQDDGYISKSTTKFYKYKVQGENGREKNWHKVYEKYIVECKQRNSLGCKIAIEHTSRGLFVMVFVEHIQHGKIIFKQLNTIAPQLKIYFLSGMNERDYISHIKKAAKNKQINILIVTRKLFGEGVDIPAVDTLINLAGGESVIVFTQMFGRGLRLNEGKERLFYIDFIDLTHEWLERHSYSRIRHCKQLKQEVRTINLDNQEEIE
jgi:superfamily II DNA or RNA helicase